MHTQNCSSTGSKPSSQSSDGEERRTDLQMLNDKDLEAQSESLGKTDIKTDNVTEVTRNMDQDNGLYAQDEYIDPPPDGGYAVSYTHLDVYKRQVRRVGNTQHLGNEEFIVSDLRLRW